LQDLYAQQVLGVHGEKPAAGAVGGIISVIVTPIYMVTNTVTYVPGARKLSGAVE
jgi:hypothetical protein